jgi:hypothetical protein
MALSIEAQQQELKKRLSPPKEALTFTTSSCCLPGFVIIAGLSSAGGSDSAEELQISRDLLLPWQKGNAKRRKHTLARARS